MKGLKGACMFCQSGGPTAVINSSAAGVFLEALKQDNITAGLRRGARRARHPAGEVLRHLQRGHRTSSSCCATLRPRRSGRRGISSRTTRSTPPTICACSRCSKSTTSASSSTTAATTAWTPATRSASSWKSRTTTATSSACPRPSTTTSSAPTIAPATPAPPSISPPRSWSATSTPRCTTSALVCIIEVMGRNAGWLAASAALADHTGLGADLIYLPEIPFSVDKFVQDVFKVCERNEGKCIAVVAEGLKDAGRQVCRRLQGGRARPLRTRRARRTRRHPRRHHQGAPRRQSASHRAQPHAALRHPPRLRHRRGRGVIRRAPIAVRAAVAGETDKMVVFERDYGADTYVCNPALVSLEHAANAERKVPLEWIVDGGTGISEEFVKYALPLIQGRRQGASRARAAALCEAQEDLRQEVRDGQIPHGRRIRRSRNVTSE